MTTAPTTSIDPLAPRRSFDRIVCLTEETTETLYLLGEQDRIVGVSGYTVRPPEARRKPKVSAFITARSIPCCSRKSCMRSSTAILPGRATTSPIINIFIIKKRKS